MSVDYRKDNRAKRRVLFCIGVTPATFELAPARAAELIRVIKETFENLRSRFGIEVLGTMDDDELMVGASVAFPWTSYILADVPDLDAVAALTNLLRTTDVLDARLWKFLRIEARVGRELFFANE